METAMPDAFARAVGATAKRQEDLEIFRVMLAAANQTMNLVGASTLGDFWNRHVVDSAQLLCFAPQARVWADLGTGGGLPGLVLAILLKDQPGSRVHLIESVAKRCRFLASVAARLGLLIEIHNARAESLRLKVEMVTARACAPLERLMGFAEPYFDLGARGLFLKGETADAEIERAEKRWRFKARVHPSLSDPRGRVVSIERLSRRGTE